MKRLLIGLIWLACTSVWSQETIVSGKVTEAKTGTPVPFATVVFVGTEDGAITDFDGNFIAKTYKSVDSVAVTYIGYVRRAKPIVQGESQVIDIQLEESLTSLDEVVVFAGENPAFEILRRVNDNKKLNDKRQLEAYEYESYTRTEFDVNDMSENFRERKIMSKITNVLDSIEQIAGEDGQPILPVFISEAISRFHYRKNPTAKHEKMIRTRISGVGITDGTLTSQVIGSSFQEYNFYQNWLNIVDKEFASPIADGGRLLYEYDLMDSLEADGRFCYQIEFRPKQEQDLAFNGTMWITMDTYALKRIDAYVSDKANLNLINKIKIQQDLESTDAGPWLPNKTRVVIQIKRPNPRAAGFLGKFYVSNKDFVVNQPKERDFYLNSISMDPDVRKQDQTYWSEARHDSLSRTEENVFVMIDSLKRIPQIKFLTEVLKFASTGYFKVGKIDVGPYTTFVGNNDVEGFRMGMGARTNISFSDKWVFGGYLGYGFDDEKYKYNFYAQSILNRKPWSTITYEQQDEIEQVWLLNEDINPASLFYTFNRFGTLTQPFAKKKYKLNYQQQIGKGLTADFSFQHDHHEPLFDFNYFLDENRSMTGSAYRISEVSGTIRYGRDEIFVINDNDRISLGTLKSPIFILDYTHGADGIFGSEFNYDKLRLNILKSQKMGVFGVSDFQLGGGYFFGEAPYSMLFSPIGNETPFFVDFAYGLIDYYEFTSDRYAEFRFNHSFEGFFLNRIPLLRKLKLRTVINANILIGGLSDENISINQFQPDGQGNEIRPFRQWGRDPYVEVAYGISNVFRFFSVRAFHRLTYLDQGVNGFGVKFGAQFQL